MDFAETEEQSMIREMVRDFAEEVLAPTCLDRDRDQRPPLEEWKTFCEYGLQGITIPEEYGGNPIDDIQALQKIKLVVKEGNGYKPESLLEYAVGLTQGVMQNRKKRFDSIY